MGFMVGAVWLRPHAASHARRDEEFVSVAMMGPKSRDRVMQVLKSSDIPAVTWGGSHTGFWVQVPESEAYRAISLLRKDAGQLHYPITFGDQHPLSKGDQWITPWADAPYADILGRPQYSSLTEVGACLRIAEVASVAMTYSKISRISYFRQTLSGVSGRIAVIEDLWLEKFPESYGGKRRITGFQVIDGGLGVHCVSDTEASDH